MWLLFVARVVDDDRGGSANKGSVVVEAMERRLDGVAAGLMEVHEVEQGMRLEVEPVG